MFRLKKKRNILLLGAGRRVEFVRILQGAGFNVFSIEGEYSTPIGKIIPSYYSAYNYSDDDTAHELLKTIMDTVHAHDIGMVIPLMDSAVSFCKKELYKHVYCLTGPTDECYDKYKFQQFMLNNFPSSYPIPENANDCILKPRRGNSSKGIEKIKFKSDWMERKTSVIQKRIYGTEYSVDCIFDSFCKPILTISRSRDVIAGGEVKDSVIRYMPSIENLSGLIGEKLRLIGPANFQWISSVYPYTLNNYLIEVNERFGGGCTLSLNACPQILNILKDFYDNKRVSRTDYDIQINYNLKMKRYMESHYYEA